MSDIDPTLASVVSREYWEPIPPLYAFTRHSAIGRLFEVAAAHSPDETMSTKMDRTVHEQVCSLLSGAALQLLNGEPVEQIDQGELIGSKDDSRYYLPGNVLLIDREQINISDGPLRGLRHVIKDDFEVAMNALALFKRSTTLITSTGQEPRQTWQPYEGTVTQVVDGKVHEYKRTVDLIAACPAKNGKTTSIGLNLLTLHANGDMEVDVPKGNFDSSVGGARRSMWPAARVGQVINRSVNDKWIDLYRIRSAALCLRGSLQYAPAKRRTRRQITRSLVPSFIHPN